jgi:DNA-3-methyladenine glycosylase II
MHYVEHLSKDKKLAALIEKQGPFKLKKRKHLHLTLAGSIMSQQLSTKVAATFQKRFLALYDSANPTANEIAATAFETIRAIGLSNQKTRYILNVAEFFCKETDAEKKIRKMGNEEIIVYLTQIKGVGKWTTEMLLMFTLARENVFPVDDYGIQAAMKKLYRLNDDNKKIFREKLHKIAERWEPYQTYACLHLWNWKDTKE